VYAQRQVRELSGAQRPGDLSTRPLNIQPFSQKSRTATIPKVFQIGLCGVVDTFGTVAVRDFWENGCIQAFCQKPRTPTVTQLLQIGLHGVAEADLEVWCNSWRARFLRERLYSCKKARYNLSEDTTEMCVFVKINVTHLVGSWVGEYDTSFMFSRATCQSGCALGGLDGGCCNRNVLMTERADWVSSSATSPCLGAIFFLTTQGRPQLDFRVFLTYLCSCHV